MLSISRSALRCKTLLLLVLLTFNASAASIAIDEESLLNAVKQDKDALYERKILVKHYITQHRYDEASAMNSAILKSDPKDKDALKQKQKIMHESKLYTLLEQNSLAKPGQQPSAKFFDTSKAENCEIYSALSYFKRDLDPKYHEKMIRYYIKTKQFDKAHKTLGNNRQISKVTSLRLNAMLASAQGAYPRAADLYKQTYQESGELSDAINLLELQIKQKDYKAIIFYAQLKQKYKTSSALKAYKKPVKKLEAHQFKTLKANYEKEDTLATLQPYVNTLFAVHKRQEAISITSDFDKRHATDESSLFLAQLYYWNGSYTRSINTIQSQKEPRTSASRLLLGKLYSVTKQFDKAKVILEGLVEDEDDTIAYDAKKQYAYIILWEGEEKLAIAEFESLIEIKKDRDIEKTLRYLAFTDEEKILYFRKQLKQDPHDKTAKITLAQLYLKQEETHAEGITLLQENATEYQEVSDYLLLAQNAYWVQQNDTALSAIDLALLKEPDNEKALALRREVKTYQADTLYFAGNYSGALVKYAALEREAPLDKSRKLHQALCLEYDKQYRYAKEHFSAIYAYDKRDYILFHIAFNTMQLKEYNSAKTDFMSVIDHAEFSSEDPAIYTLAKENIAFIDAKLNAPKAVVLANGLVMAPLVEKDLLGEQEVFASTSAQSLNEDDQNRLQAHPRFNKGELRLDYYRNKDDVEFKAISTAYERKYLFDKWGMGADIGYFTISDPIIGKQDGMGAGITVSDKHFSIRLGINIYEEFSEFAPVLQYKNSYGSLSYLFEYAYQNAMFYTMSPQALDEQIGANHLEASGYYYGGERWNVWSSIALNIYSDDNTAFIPQFDYSFYRFIFSKRFSVATSLNGWYSFNSNPSPSYYSPGSYDSTLMGLRPRWEASDYLIVNAIFDAGYSFTTDSPLYNFGLFLSMPEKDGLKYEVGCRESNAARNTTSLTTIDYYEVECTGLLEYSWQ